MRASSPGTFCAGGQEVHDERERQAYPGNGDMPLVWDEQAIDSLMTQFRYMLTHEVKNMKLEVIENMGSMLAKRSGIDREIHELTARVDLQSRLRDSISASRLMRNPFPQSPATAGGCAERSGDLGKAGTP